MVWRPVRGALFRRKLLWGVAIVVAVAVFGYGLVSRADVSIVPDAEAIRIETTRTPVTSSTSISAPSTTGTSTSTTTTPSTTTSTTSTTVPVTTTVAIVWEPGSVTCAEVEDHIPYGVDDWGGSIFTGLLAPMWGDNQSLTLQYLDDPTCTVDSNAWRFLIKIVLNANLWGNNTDVCIFYKGLADSESPPRNLGSVMSLAAPACLDQW